MIPVSLYGIDTEQTEEFFASFQGLLQAAEDPLYISMLYRIEGPLCLEHLSMIDEWCGSTPLVMTEELSQEILSALQVVSYPDVSLVERLLTIDGVDVRRLSHWLHFTTLIYPIWSSDACAGLRRLGLRAPFVEDITAYGVYVALIEGMKEYAPMDALPESPLPRQRLLELALAEWSRKA